MSLSKNFKFGFVSTDYQNLLVLYGILTYFLFFLWILCFLCFTFICCLRNLKHSDYDADNILNKTAESIIQVSHFIQKLHISDFEILDIHFVNLNIIPEITKFCNNTLCMSKYSTKALSFKYNPQIPVYYLSQTPAYLISVSTTRSP